MVAAKMSTTTQKCYAVGWTFGNDSATVHRLVMCFDDEKEATAFVTEMQRLVDLIAAADLDFTWDVYEDKPAPNEHDWIVLLHDNRSEFLAVEALQELLVADNSWLGYFQGLNPHTHPQYTMACLPRAQAGQVFK